MNISLTPEFESMIQEKVKSGMYHTASEVIRDALRLMQEQDQFRQMKLENLRREIDIGLKQIERGEVSVWDPKKIKKEFSERKAKESAK